MGGGGGGKKFFFVTEVKSRARDKTQKKPLPQRERDLGLRPK
jgi:hypothetical protein